MKKVLLFFLFLSFPAIAADNAVIVTPGTGVTMRSIDVGTGVQSMGNSLVNSSGTNIIGAGTTVPISGSLTNISGTISLPTGAATAANQATEISSLATIATNTGAAIPAGTANIGNVGLISQYPIGAVAITASATGTTGATTATLAASASIKTYICGFSIRANATGAATGNSTVTGTVTGTLNYTQWTAPLASGIGLTEQVFMPCVPSSAINTAIAVISAAPGTGGVVSVAAWGYQL